MVETVAKSSKKIDLMAPLLEQKGSSRSKRGTSIEVKSTIILDLGEAERAAFTLCEELAEQIRGELGASSRTVKQETRDRRRRSQQTPQSGRYPAGASPNPGGSYGVDSGYLRDNIKAALESGNKAFVGIPRNRQKAAFVLRKVSPTSRLEGSGTKEAMDDGLEKALQKMLVLARGGGR